MDVHNWACASSLKCMDNCVWGSGVLFWGFLSNGAKNWHIFGYNHWFCVTSNQSAKSSLSKVSPTFPVWETVFKVWYYFSTTQNRQRGVSAFYVFVRCPNKPSSWVLPMLFLLTDLIIITIKNTTWPTRQHISQTWVGVQRVNFIGYNRMSLFATFSLGSPSKHTLRRRLPFFCPRSIYVVPTSNFKILLISLKRICYYTWINWKFSMVILQFLAPHFPCATLRLVSGLLWDFVMWKWCESLFHQLD